MSRSYKKYTKEDDNIHGINISFSSSGNILANGTKYVVDKTKTILSKSTLQTQLTSSYFTLGKMVFEEYFLEIDNSKKIKRLLKKMGEMRNQLDAL